MVSRFLSTDGHNSRARRLIHLESWMDRRDERRSAENFAFRSALHHALNLSVH
jgi:hypothetical protein